MLTLSKCARTRTQHSRNRATPNRTSHSLRTQTSPGQKVNPILHILLPSNDHDVPADESSPPTETGSCLHPPRQHLPGPPQNSHHQATDAIQESKRNPKQRIPQHTQRPSFVGLSSIHQRIIPCRDVSVRGLLNFLSPPRPASLRVDPAPPMLQQRGRGTGHQPCT